MKSHCWNDNEELVKKHQEVIDLIVEGLGDLQVGVEGGECNNLDTDLFDADAFWVSFYELVAPHVKSVV